MAARWLEEFSRLRSDGDYVWAFDSRTFAASAIEAITNLAP